MAGTDSRLGRQEREVGTGHYEAIWLYLGCNWLNIEAEALFGDIVPNSSHEFTNINIHGSSSPPPNKLLPAQ